MLTWMLYALLIAALVAVGARGVEQGLRAAGLPARFVWLSALAVTVVLSVLAPLRASGPGGERSPAAVESAGATGVVEVAAGRRAEASSSRSGAVAELLEAVAGVGAAVEWPLRASAEWSRGRGTGILGVLWLALAVGWLVAGGVTVLRYARARSGWPAAEVCGTAVRIAPAAGPAVMGLFRPEIVLPEWLLSRSAAERRLVVLHEREHLRSRDGQTLTAGWLAAALMPWNPAVWWMLSRLRLAVELDCDARVLRRGIAPREYGSVLIDVAGNEPGLFLGAPALTGSPSTLETRILAMTTNASRPLLLRSIALAALGAAALVAACDARMPTSAEIEELDAASAVAGAEQWRVLAPTGEGVTYTLDGEEITVEEAHAVAADELAQVRIVRGPGGATINLSSELGGHPVTASRITVESEDIELSMGGDDDRLSAEGFEGLLIIDGVIVDVSAGGLPDLAPEEVESVEVVKGGAAQRLYAHPRAARGVILITTRGVGETR